MRTDRIRGRAQRGARRTASPPHVVGGLGSDPAAGGRRGDGDHTPRTPVLSPTWTLRDMRTFTGTSAVSNDSWPEGGAGLGKDSVRGAVPKKRMGGGVAMGAPPHRGQQKGPSVCAAAPGPQLPWAFPVCGGDGAVLWSPNSRGHHGHCGRDNAGAGRPWTLASDPASRPHGAHRSRSRAQPLMLNHPALLESVSRLMPADRVIRRTGRL